MAKRRTSLLYKRFQPEMYLLKLGGQTAKLSITGKKLAPPSKRLTLHQQGIRILKARIHSSGKAGDIEHEVTRINHLPTFQEVRFHASELLYPGDYRIELEYRLDSLKADRLKSDAPNRELIPSIDEPSAWASAELEIK